MTFDEFISHLDGVKGSGNQRYARCPAHEDKHQSLSVSVADDGKILLNCHAGCTAKDITEAMGLSIKDLFVDKAVPKSKTIVATYKYIDQNGKTSEKLRYSNKSFQWRHKGKNGGWEYNRKGISPSLYMTGWGQLQSPVYLVEGEKDADALISVQRSAVSPPDGAGSKWYPQYTESLRGLDVVIIQDNDEAGIGFAQKAASELIEAARSVKVLDLTKIWPELPKHGDASDLLNHMGKQGAVKAIERLAGETPRYSVSDKAMEPEQLPCFFHEKKFMHNIMGDYLTQHCSVCKINGTLHVYHNGVYKAGEEILHGKMIELLPDITDARRREVFKYMNASLSTPVKELAPPNLIPFATRIYNVDTDTFLDYSPEYVFLNRFPYDYNPDVPLQPLVTETISQIAAYDSQVIELIYEAIGNCFYLLNSFRGAVMLYGRSGNNGKSTLLNMITQLLGKNNASFLSLQDLSERFRLVEIYGKAANIGDDIPNSYLPDSSIFKKAVTGERIVAEKKGQDPFPFKPYAKLFFAMNGLPPVSDKSKAFFGRILLIPLNQDFSKLESRNVNLKDRQWTKEEMEYLTVLAVQALKRLLERGDFIRPKCVIEAQEEYERENNPVMEFLDEYGNVSGQPTQEVYVEYDYWCRRNGHRNILSRRKFSDEVIRQTGLTSESIRHPYFNNKPGRCFVEKCHDVT